MRESKCLCDLHRKQLRLIVAAPPLPKRVHRNRHDEGRIRKFELRARGRHVGGHPLCKPGDGIVLERVHDPRNRAAVRVGVRAAEYREAAGERASANPVAAKPLRAVGAQPVLVAADGASAADADRPPRKQEVEREAEQISYQIAELNQNIDFILSDDKPENDHLATPLEARLIGLEQRVTSRKEEVVTGQQTAQALAEATSTLRVRYQNMVQQIQRLEAMDRATKAKESAVKAMRQAGKIASTGADVSVDAVADRIQRRADVADAKFAQVMGEMRSDVKKDVVIAQAQARLEQRKARLALSAPQPQHEA